MTNGSIWDRLAHLGGLLFVLVILCSILIIFTIIILDECDKKKKRKLELNAWSNHLKNVEEARNDFK